MVGWSRRNRERDEEDARYRKWFNSLPQEEQERIRLQEVERWKRDKPKVIAAMIAGFLLMFVGWPMLAIWHAQERWKAQWNAGKVVSQDSKQVCKEVEYCAPCSPIHHWHKKVFCEPVDRK